MLLSDLSVRRPVLATVINCLIIMFGLVAFYSLPLREYPNIDPPVVTVTTDYRGASAQVVDSKITELIEERIAGLEGIKTIESTSQDGRSRVTIRFQPNRDINDATNDVRDRVFSLSDNLPKEADNPEVEKTDSSDNVIMWLNLNGTDMSLMEITDYARRYVQEQFAALDGVARVRIGGAQDMALRIWLRQDDLRARQLSVQDILSALRAQNIELPAGYIETGRKDFTVKMARQFLTIDEFRQLPLRYEEDGSIIRLGEVATVKLGAVEKRTVLRGNGIPMVGIGIIKQATANTLAVARLAKQKMNEVNNSLPSNMVIQQSYDTSLFIEQAIREVYKTIALAVLLVVMVIYLFIRQVRAMLIPSLSIPTALLGGFLGLYVFDSSINLLTLLALVLAIGLIIDDAIVVIENIFRRIELGETPLLAAYKGSKQVAFAVISTTVVLVAIFIPIGFIEGDIGRLFGEFATMIVGCLVCSTVAALSIVPVLASKMLQQKSVKSDSSPRQDSVFQKILSCYQLALKYFLERPHIIIMTMMVILVSAFFFLWQLPSELTPKEDRGAFFMFMRGPQGVSYDYTMEHVYELEQRLLPFVESGEFRRLLFRVPGSFGTASAFNSAIGIVVLNDWGSGRKPIWYYVNEVRARSQEMSGVLIFPVVRQALGGRSQKPIQFVLGGATYDELVQARDIILTEANKLPYFQGLDSDYLATKPYLEVHVDHQRAADLGVSLREINETLEVLLGTRRETTYLHQGEEYDVIIESDKSDKKLPRQISEIFVRSKRSNQLVPLANLISLQERAYPEKLHRTNRLRSITIEGNMAPGVSLGTALAALGDIAAQKLPPGIQIDYKGTSESYQTVSYEIMFFFGLALLVTYLVLAAQFESFIHPIIIMLTVPLAMVGSLAALWLTGQSLNIYSEISLIILIGIAAKNGILIVEFINQLRDHGTSFQDAIIQAASKRFRPIIMTAITTAMGALPLILSSGAGSESRYVIGVVILSGVLFAMIFTLFVIPVMYQLLARHTKSPAAIEQQLEQEIAKHRHVD